MSAGRDELRDLIEAHASSAQRGPLARLREDYDDDENEPRETVGDAIEGAATTTTDSARQAAALVSNQPSHKNVGHNLRTFFRNLNYSNRCPVNIRACVNRISMRLIFYLHTRVV